MSKRSNLNSRKNTDYGEPCEKEYWRDNDFDKENVATLKRGYSLKDLGENIRKKYSKSMQNSKSIRNLNSHNKY